MSSVDKNSDGLRFGVGVTAAAAAAETTSPSELLVEEPEFLAAADDDDDDDDDDNERSDTCVEAAGAAAEAPPGSTAALFTARAPSPLTPSAWLLLPPPRASVSFSFGMCAMLNPRSNLRLLLCCGPNARA